MALRPAGVVCMACDILPGLGALTFLMTAPLFGGFHTEMPSRADNAWHVQQGPYFAS